MTVTHENNIALTIILDPAPPSRAGFGNVLLIAEVDFNGGADRIRTYSKNGSAADDDLAAGDITSSVKDAIDVAFSQDPAPSTFKVGRVDLTGGETYTDALTAIEDIDTDWYGLAIEDRSDSEIEEVGALAETRNILFAAQSDAADLISGSLSSFSALSGNERTIIEYHDDDSEWMDVGHLASRLVFDPGATSAPWYNEVKSVAAYSTALTVAQRDNAEDNNINTGLPYGTADFWVDPGVNFNGRPIYEMVTADWFRARVQEDVIAMTQTYSKRGEKIPLTRAGQLLLKSKVLKRFGQGVAAGHFKPGQINVDLPEITSTDLDNERIRIEAQATLLVGGRKLDLTFNFTRNDVVEEAA